MKRITYCIFIVCIFVFCTDTANATRGGLRKSTIKTCPNGITYGLHSDGHGGTHWHVAITNGNNYYADGGAIYYDPCPSSTTNQGTAGSTSGSSSSGNNSHNSYNSSNSNVSNSNSSTDNTNNSSNNNAEAVKKSDDKTIKLISINGDEITDISDNMSYSSTKKTLDVKVVTADEKATYKVDGTLDGLSKNDSRKIYIIVTAEDGSTKTYNINVIRKIIKGFAKISSFKVNSSTVTFDDSNTGEVSMFNYEDKFNIEYTLSDNNATLVVTKNNKKVESGDKIKTGKNKYILTVIDADENEINYQLTVERWSVLESIIYTLLTLAILGGIGYLIYYVIKKNRARKKQIN